LYPSQGSAVLRTAQVRSAGGYDDASLGEDWGMRCSLAFRGRVLLRDRPAFVYLPGGGRRTAAYRSAEIATAAGRVRRRLRSDPAVPGWAKALLPIVGLGQFAIVHVLRPATVLFRRLAAATVPRAPG
jgi:hypothetical protein